MKVAHLFAALRVGTFGETEAFKALMDEMIRDLRTSAKVEGHDRIYVAGEIEWEIEQERREKGIPLDLAVVASLHEVSTLTGVPLEIG